jgi:hypothetical protein
MFGHFTNSSDSNLTSSQSTETTTHTTESNSNLVCLLINHTERDNFDYTDKLLASILRINLNDYISGKYRRLIESSKKNNSIME